MQISQHGKTIIDLGLLKLLIKLETTSKSRFLKKDRTK